MPTYNNKVVLRDGTVVLDVTPTTAIESDVASGKIFVKADGSIGTGTASGGDNVFLITLSWDDDFLPVGAEEPGAWVPDQTWAEIKAAYNAGKTITVDASAEYKLAEGWYEGGEYPFFSYEVFGWDDSAKWKWYSYGLFDGEDHEEVLACGGYLELIDPWFDSPSRTYTPSEQVQTETITYDPNHAYNGIEEVNVTVNAIPSNYVGSGVTRRSSSDLSASGATVSVPAGFYENAASKAVASGSEGTPTATKGSVSNHAVTVTPSVTNTAGYISGGTKTGTGVSVTAAELVSGTYAVDSSGTKDVTNYASASVPAGTAGTPTATKGTVEQHSVEITPSVTNTAGYISGGTKTGTPVTVTASELVSGSTTLTSNNTYDVTNFASVVVNVAGSGGVGTLLKTYSMGTISTSSTQAANTGKTITGVDISDGYDLLIVETSVNSVTNNRHTATVGMILLTASSTVGTKDGATVCSNKWNSKVSSSGTTTTRQSTTAYGIYPYSCTINNESLSISMYQRYNSTQTGTINNAYTARVYGVKLFDLIGG